jgi:Domain of unknown function (DUF4148)
MEMQMPHRKPPAAKHSTPLFQPASNLEPIMTFNRIIALTLSGTISAAAISFAGAAHADNTLTREQVKAELREAQRNGDLLDYETGKKPNEVNPSAYPRQVKVAPVATAPAAVTYTAIGDFEMDLLNQRSAALLQRAEQQRQFAGKR